MKEELQKEIIDDYLEHEFHIVGAQGKTVPFWKNKNNCSTCYTEHMKLKSRSQKTYNSTESSTDFRHDNYRIN